MGAPTVQLTIFVSDPELPQPIAMVEYADGSFGVLRDGKPVEPARYPAARLADCIDHFRRLSRSMSPN